MSIAPWLQGHRLIGPSFNITQNACRRGYRLVTVLEARYIYFWGVLVFEENKMSIQGFVDG
jgi:hypothetical protein